MSKFNVGDEVIADKRFKGRITSRTTSFNGEVIYCISVDGHFGDFYYGAEYLELVSAAPQRGLCECGGWKLQEQGWDNAHDHWCPAYRGRNKFTEEPLSDSDD